MVFLDSDLTALLLLSTHQTIHSHGGDFLTKKLTARRQPFTDKGDLAEWGIEYNNSLSSFTTILKLLHDLLLRTPLLLLTSRVNYYTSPFINPTKVDNLCNPALNPAKALTPTKYPAIYPLITVIVFIAIIVNVTIYEIKRINQTNEVFPLRGPPR